MAYIIDETYFQRNLHVPNSDELNTGAYAELQEYIDSKARLCLKSALGYKLFNEFDGNVTNGVLDDGAPQKWIDLVNGKEYTINGDLFRWEGLIQTEGAFNKSLLANFVYYHWLNDNQSSVTGVGEVVLNAKNATNINSTQRLVSVWNEFVEMYQGKMFEHYKHTYYYRNIKIVDYLGDAYDDEYVSLVRFLIDNKEDYPEAAIKRYQFINQFGI